MTPIEIMKGLKPYFEDYHHSSATPTRRSRRRSNCRPATSHDRKLPDKAIDVIDETGAAQMLLPVGKRQQD